ncbi:troponin I, fast skeletal muscle-like isoform X2 [Coregonus clupeaformis]|nr:troponin I, fast skeletal muscle-like isoform X2 [Coregonus clupeaformis]XP_045074961.1 troponin I, fast skeletal muscle-like isoform X2 [Coregonus clupeaformis]
MSSSRKQHLKSLMLQIAQGLIEAEAIQAEEEKNRYMDENVPSLSIPGHMQELQIEDLKIKVQDLKGKFKKPVLKKVLMLCSRLCWAPNTRCPWI